MDTTMAMGLFEDSNEQEKSLEDSIQMEFSPQSAWYRLVTMYQNVRSHGECFSVTRLICSSISTSKIRNRSGENVLGD